MMNIENPAAYWLDDKTFILAFDGGVDEDGDEYSYQAQYYRDAGTFTFERWYEGYITPAGFSCEQEEYIKSIMLDKIAAQQDIKGAGNMQDAPVPATLDQQMTQEGKGMKDSQKKYLTEAYHRIQHEGFTVSEEKDGLLSVEWAGSTMCSVNGSGGMSYDPEQIRKGGLDDSLDRVREIVDDTLAYMRQMETAPLLQAEGVSGDYRLLAEYNGTVLAGHPTQYGVQFITWDRLENGTLWQGHYFNAGEGMDAAKRDFAARSGLLPAGMIFTREQLAVIFDAAQNMTTLDLVSNPEQGKLLEGIMEQIEEAVPQVIDLANELTQSPKQHEAGEMRLY